MNAADLADIWWNEQPPERRIAIHGWLSKDAPAHHPIEGQLEMFPTDTDRTDR